MNLIKEIKEMKEYLMKLDQRVGDLDQRVGDLDQRYKEIAGKLEVISKDVGEIRKALIDGSKGMAERLQKK